MLGGDLDSVRWHCARAIDESTATYDRPLLSCDRALTSIDALVIATGAAVPVDWACSTPPTIAVAVDDARGNGAEPDGRWRQHLVRITHA